MITHPIIRSFKFLGLLALLFVFSACASNSTRIIKNYVSVDETIGGKTESQGGWDSESITTCKGPKITTAWPLLNLTFFPLITLTGPWSDTFEASQKKVVIHYLSTDKIKSKSELEVKLKMKIKNPIMIAEALSASDYVDDVFDFVWERAASDMADDIGITRYNAKYSFFPPFHVDRLSNRKLKSETALPDIDQNNNTFDTNGEYSISHKNSNEWLLKNFLRKYGIGEINVQLWAETRSPSGELLARQQRNYIILPSDK